MRTQSLIRTSPSLLYRRINHGWNTSYYHLLLKWWRKGRSPCLQGNYKKISNNAPKGPEFHGHARGYLHFEALKQNTQINLNERFKVALELLIE